MDAYEEYQEDFDPRFGEDCHGHGTHVSSLCGGKTFGSAKDVNLYSVRVLQCDNAAPWSVVIDGLEYVSRVVPERGRPAVVSMSLGGGFYLPMNEAVQSIHDQGITVIVAAGNGNRDSCTRSPASSEYAISVGGTREGDGLYLAGSGTNFGSCIDIFAPGENIVAADFSCQDCSKVRTPYHHTQGSTHTIPRAPHTPHPGLHTPYPGLHTHHTQASTHTIPHTPYPGLLHIQGVKAWREL